MDNSTFVASLVQSAANLITGIAWPVALLVVVLLFRNQVRELLTRMVEAEGFGFKGRFDRTAAVIGKATEDKTRASVGVATGTGQAHDATVRVRESLVSTLEEVAHTSPNTAVLAAFAEVEKALRRRLHDAGLPDIETSSMGRVLEGAVAEGAISTQSAESVRGLSVLRNMAAHGRDVTPDEALEYLAMSDGAIYSVEAPAATIRGK